MATKNIITEDSIKAVLEQIAHDIASKIDVNDLSDGISEYFQNSSDNVDLTTAVIDIINNNTETIDLKELLESSFDFSELIGSSTELVDLTSAVIDIINNNYQATELASLIPDLSEYAKKSDIPTGLPSDTIDLSEDIDFTADDWRVS